MPHIADNCLSAFIDRVNEHPSRLQRQDCTLVAWNGEYDVVVIVEAPDDISMTALGLSSGALGNVRGG